MSFTTFTPGIKYIKISKFDSTGIDNTLSLQEITDLRLNTNDNGFINYPIVGRTEYADYFLLQTVTTNITSSTNNQILDYQLVVTQSSPSPYTTNADSGLLLIGNYDSPVIDQQNYFNNTSGLYTLDNTPNIPIIFTASYRIFSTSGIVNPTLAAVLNGGSSVSSTSNVINSLTLFNFNSPPQTMTISGSFTPIEGQTFGIYFGDLSTSFVETIVGQFVHLSFTQSQSPIAGIESQVIIEPYLSVPFINSDYDSLINNAVVSRPNDNFFDVDFGSNQITAVNEASIISASKGTGFATLSTVPESNYTTTRIISPRYIGKELTSAEFNEYTGPTTNFTSSLGFQTGSYPGDVAYGKTSNVGNPATNFVYFEYLAGSSPEWGGPGKEGKTVVNIRYIIDENGNAISPINDTEGINLGTIQQTFNGIDGAIISLDDNDAFGVDFGGLNGLQSVFKSGYRIDPITYTQSGSSFAPTIFFLNPAGGALLSCNDFWEAPSLPTNIITASFTLNSFIGLQQVDIPNSGFFPISNTFNPQLFDEIRFEGTEELTFLIVNIGTTPDPFTFVPLLTLTLDKNIPPGTDLDYFLLRRYTPDPSSILLNITKGSGATSTGILKPEYISPELDSKITSIIDDLKSKNII
jgi:hypothetical protein